MELRKLRKTYNEKLKEMSIFIDMMSSKIFMKDEDKEILEYEDSI